MQENLILCVNNEQCASNAQG
jgi:hypothetical protein